MGLPDDDFDESFEVVEQDSFSLTTAEVKAITKKAGVAFLFAGISYGLAEVYCRFIAPDDMCEKDGLGVRATRGAAVLTLAEAGKVLVQGGFSLFKQSCTKRTEVEEPLLNKRLKS